MYQVKWRQLALNQVANAWLESDSNLRAAITAAANEIDRQLRENPSKKGESRSEDERILLESPIGVVYQIDQHQRIVEVLRAWAFPRHRAKGEIAD